jgi:hypothetical protein
VSVRIAAEERCLEEKASPLSMPQPNRLTTSGAGWTWKSGNVLMHRVTAERIIRGGKCRIVAMKSLPQSKKTPGRKAGRGSHQSKRN